MTICDLKATGGRTLFIVAMFLSIALPRSIQSAPAQNISSPAPGPNDAKITYVTARLLEDFHYSRQQFDRSISERFFDEYLETLDPRRENFLQSDIDQFARYRTNLDVYTTGGHVRSDLTPAYEIFNRFKQRLTQHAAYVDELLKQNKLAFNNSDRIVIDRRHAPWPKNVAEAQQLWRDRVRFEFLQEKLGRELSPTNENVVLPLNKTNLVDIATQLQKHYTWTLHMLTNWDNENILSAYLNAMVHAYDPHSDYLNDEHAQTFSIEMSLTLYGIGAQLSEEDGYCTIESLVPGGPADKSNQVRQKDKIVAVAQSNQPPVNVVDVELPRVVGMIRGAKGTQVRLTIIPAEEPSVRRVISLIREEIKLEDQKAKARLVEFFDARGHTNRLGVVSVPSFYATIPLNGNENHDATNFVSADVKALLNRLKQENVSGVIVDMRGDPGGSLEEAVNFTGLFIKDGPVVTARSSDQSTVTKSDFDTNVVYAGPLLVLVNRFSASASEIVAGALQDYERAIIVGDTNTFGKGTVQQLAPLRPFVWPQTPTATNDPGTLKITISKFYRVSGFSTQFKGVASDIVLPDVLNHAPDIGEMALDYPLPWDTNEPALYDKLNLVQPYLAQLRLRSEARVATNQDFTYIRQDIDEYNQLQADKTATLNEQEALKDRQEKAAKDKARSAERSTRRVPSVRIYDLTVENAGKPGLPPPLSLTLTNYPDSALNPPSLETNALPKTDAERWKSSRKYTVVNAAPVDPTLDEAEHILLDYIALLSATNHDLIANHP